MIKKLTINDVDYIEQIFNLEFLKILLSVKNLQRI